MNNKEYKPSEIEGKWQKLWQDHKVYEPDIEGSRKPFDAPQGKPFYNLMMFPYPSAEGLHVGNMYAFCGSDIYGRYKRMRGNDVFEPIGLDGFGIHSENFALKIGEHPMEVAKRTEANFYKQLHMIGNGYAWNHKLETYDPEYFRWTQWIFVQLFKSGLAYRGKAKVNWCPHCLTVLADEQAIKQNPKSSTSQKLRGASKIQNPKLEEISVCERCGIQVERKDLSQWFFRITNYSQRLLDNLEKLDWSEKVKLAQRNWIGRSDGAKMMFHCDIQSDCLIEVFTTRPDTIYGVTFLVLAPEHPLVTKIINKANGPLQQEIRQYIDYSLKKTEEERLETKIEAKNRVKNGIFSGFYATNPLNKKKVPIYIADYVLMSYGTGAVMGVPAHDQRDFEFAKKYKLDIVKVIESASGQKSDISRGAFTEEGRLVDSGQFSGLTTEDGIQSVIKYINKNQIGTSFAAWHLRDWIISRQRYWGPPIPIIYCEKCAKEGKSWFTATSGPADGNALELGHLRRRGQRSDVSLHEAQVGRNSKTASLQATSPRTDLGWDHFGWYPVDEEDLPVLLPYIKQFKPTGSGVSPLAQDKDFVNVKCPGCGAKAKRETDVSDTFLDSAWYFLRYPSVKSVSQYIGNVGKSVGSVQSVNTGKTDNTESTEKLPWDPEITERWLPVDMYIGGAEHAVLHLLYSRFLTMALYDMGILGFEEPFAKFRVNGLLIKDGAKMSKSKGNVVIPDGYIRKFGADTLRCYLMFCGRFTAGGDFRDTGMEGMHRFLKRVWRLCASVKSVSQYTGKVGTVGMSVRPVGQYTGNTDGTDSTDCTDITDPLAHRNSLYMMHKTIKKVTGDIESLDYNTALAALMEWVNFLEKKVNQKPGTRNQGPETNPKVQTPNAGELSIEETKTLLLLLAPFAPHMCEELWQRFASNQFPETRDQKSGTFRSIHLTPWPSFDEKLIKTEKVLLIIQVDGKFREKVQVERGMSASDAQLLVLALDKVVKYTQGKKYKVVYVADKVINFVTEK